MESMSEEMRGKMPPGLVKFIEEKKNKKEQENAKLAHEKKDGEMTPAERKKKEEEEAKLAHKKENLEKGQKLNTEELSQATEQLVGRNNLNRFQELSAENKESNQEFLDMLNMKQGTFREGGAR